LVVAVASAIVSNELLAKGRKADDASDVTLSATPKGNGFQATVTWPDGVSVSSATAYPSRAEAIAAAALRVLDETRRLKALDTPDPAEP